MSKPDGREQRALEALIVSRLRNGCGEDADASNQPSLTEEEKAALKCLRPNFLQDLIKRVDSQPEVREVEEVETDEIEERELVYGLNRAEEIDEETDEELKRKRQEILDKLRGEEDGGRDCSNG